jgi:hypothetical protein
MKYQAWHREQLCGVSCACQFGLVITINEAVEPSSRKVRGMISMTMGLPSRSQGALLHCSLANMGHLMNIQKPKL